MSDSVGANNGQGSAHVYRWSGTGWVFEETLVSSDGATFDNFGSSVAIFGDIVAIGANQDDIGAKANQGSVYIFTRAGTVWTEKAKLLASDGPASSGFGGAVATDGETLIVGASGSNAGQGSAYVFTRNGNTWSEQAKLVASDGASSDHFGTSVSLSSGTIAVGADDADVSGLSNSGAAYIFVRSGATWTEQAKLVASNRAANDSLGSAISVSGDTAIIGAPQTTRAASRQGSAYIFTRTGTTWSERLELTAADGKNDEGFGTSVALSGTTALVGAIRGRVWSDTQGTAYLFSGSGATWTQQAKIFARPNPSNTEFGTSVALSADFAVVGAPRESFANVGKGAAWVFSRSGTNWIGLDFSFTANDGATGDLLGISVAMSGDTALIGAIGVKIDGQTSRGAAYVAVRQGSKWNQQARLIDYGGSEGDNFGNSVAIDGDTAVVGANFADNGLANVGTAHVFTRTGTSWSSGETIYPGLDFGAGDRFGTSVSISGNTIAVGAPLNDVGLNNDQGSVSILVFNGAFWAQQAKLLAPDGAAGDNFGTSVAISGDTVVIGAPARTVAGNTGQGAAYVFVRTGTTWILQPFPALPGATVNSFVGTAVAISGNTAVITAPGSSVNGHVFQGIAGVFLRTGNSWSFQDFLLAVDGVAYDRFGNSVSISGDVVIIGDTDDSKNLAVDQGSASIFTRSGTSWTRRGKVSEPSGNSGDFFGQGVAVSGNTAVSGVIGTDVGTNSAQGSAYFFNVYDDFNVVRNTNLFTGYSSLAQAFPFAATGNSLNISPIAFAAMPSLDTLGRTLSLTSLGEVHWPSGAGLTLGGSSTLTARAGFPCEIFGTMQVAANATTTITASNLLLWQQSKLIAGTNSLLTLTNTPFDCAITSNTNFDLLSATLQMRSTGAEQKFEVMSKDIGPVPLGLDRSIAGHYPIGTLRIGPSPALAKLVDTRDNDGAGSAAKEAVYVNTLRIDSGSRLMNAGYNIYYNTLMNNGTVDVLANLIKIGGTCPGDFNNDGLVDDSDFSVFVVGYNILDCADPAMMAGCPADLNNDGIVEDADFSIFVVAYNDLLCP